MPEPPDVGLFTRYVLENPWPLGLSLLAIAMWMLWIGFRDNAAKKLQIGAALGALGAAALLTGWFVESSSERAKGIAKALVDAVVAKDQVGGRALFSDDAAFAIRSPKNPGHGVDFIQNQLLRLAERYTIESNSITMLRGYSESSEQATVHMACFTNVNGFPYPNVSQWVLRVRREPDGEWRIAHLTCVSINDQTPPIDQFR